MTQRILVGLLALLPGLALAQRHTPKPTPPKAAGPYFQQEVNYSIDVALDDKTNFLTGREDLAYVNHSPQALAFIWFHLWPNAYKDNSTAFARQQLRDGKNRFQFAKAEDRGFIDGLDFKVNGQPAKLVFDPNNADIAKLVLPQPLAVGATASISTPFRVKIPASFSRFGHVGQSYQITQWYPKPAVLDRRGWHPIPYLDQGEFYSEFGSFDVTITLPSNYTVGATGELQNPDERARMDALAATAASKTTAEAFGTDLKFPASDATTKTLRYKQDRIHDFAWFADKRFNVLKSGVTLPSGRTVTSWVLFTNREATKWIKGLQDVNDALTYYSRWVGEYPYSAATAVDGALSAGSGMEYPMVTVTQPEAIVHEVGHNWFYGILGSNERDFPWMDEGVNTYEEGRVSELDTIKPGGFMGFAQSPRIARTFGLEKLPRAAFDQVPYQALASRGLDQPVQGLTSADYTTLNYGIVVYQKTGSLLKYLAGYLGQAKFDAAMHLYYERWQFKHPYPEDMQAVFEESTGQKLGWFFQGMLTNTQHYDADLQTLASFNDVVKVLVRTDSPTPWAVPVSSVDANGRVLETLWTAPFGNTDPNAEEEATSQLNFKRANVAALVVDANYVTPELNRRNDRLTVADHPSRATPIRLRPLASVERWDKATISWLPVLGANTSDKFMLGAAFYNNPLAPKRLQYLAMPMYSFSRNELNGIGRIQLNVLPQHLSRQATIAFDVQRFERYIKYEPSVSFAWPHAPGASPHQRLTVANTIVKDEDRDRTGVFQAVTYGVGHSNGLQGWSAGVDLNRMIASSADDANNRQALLLRASASYFRFYSRGKRVQARLFGGRFLQQPSNPEFVLGLSGSPDYRRQTAFLDRQQISHSVTAQLHQTDDRDGAFKGYLPVADTKWLSTVNLQADLPITRLAVFADFGATHDRFITSESTTRAAQRLYYDAGLVVPVLRDILQFYLPVAGSQYANGFPSNRQDFTDRIRFVLNLNTLNPFRQLDEQLAR
ncbi:M1 family metallopeptidase [Hymenobacter negativus]|uniref:M1 family metallopeptidase n=1 Tax=Hymenobacter negativus TaxID=2795026 RepID=A0ABS0Q1Z1_9BACT|nr:M1 family metallopeptidase [Hymenobacter negativus]MBH8556671.1 M1 family metallopeptidase [Hymenobacter negativus]